MLFSRDLIGINIIYVMRAGDRIADDYIFAGSKYIDAYFRLATACV